MKSSLGLSLLSVWSLLLGAAMCFPTPNHRHLFPRSAEWTFTGENKQIYIESTLGGLPDHQYLDYMAETLITHRENFYGVNDPVCTMGDSLGDTGGPGNPIFCINGIMVFLRNTDPARSARAISCKSALQIALELVFAIGNKYGSEVSWGDISEDARLNSELFKQQPDAEEAGETYQFNWDPAVSQQNEDMIEEIGISSWSEDPGWRVMVGLLRRGDDLNLACHFTAEALLNPRPGHQESPIVRENEGAPPSFAKPLPPGHQIYKNGRDFGGKFNRDSEVEKTRQKHIKAAIREIKNAFTKSHKYVCDMSYTPEMKDQNSLGVVKGFYEGISLHLITRRKEPVPREIDCVAAADIAIELVNAIYDGKAEYSPLPLPSFVPVDETIVLHEADKDTRLGIVGGAMIRNGWSW